jgi:HTH-type transcriptional regulator / antitoxin HigA
MLKIMLKTEAEFLEVQANIDALLDADKITPEKQDYLNVLGILVHEYEEKHVSIPDISGVELIQALMEEMGLEEKDLLPVFTAIPNSKI